VIKAFGFNQLYGFGQSEICQSDYVPNFSGQQTWKEHFKEKNDLLLNIPFKKYLISEGKINSTLKIILINTYLRDCFCFIAFINTEVKLSFP
jgi:hypothetical protein